MKNILTLTALTFLIGMRPVNPSLIAPGAQQSAASPQTSQESVNTGRRRLRESQLHQALI